CVIGHQFGALFGEFDSGEHVLGIAAFERGHVRGLGNGARNMLNEVDAEIHLEPGESLIAALAKPASVFLRILGLSGIRITADLVAALAAEHLIHWNVVGLARKVPKRHLDATNAARLARVEAELLDFAEDAVDVAGVLAKQPALEH